MHAWFCVALLFAIAGCEPAPGSRAPYLSAEFDGCLFASPLWIESQGERSILAAPSDGRLRALDPRTGTVIWSLELPVSAGLEPLLVATPGRIGKRLVVVYQGFDPALSEDPFDNELSRQEHRVAVVDLEARALDAEFEPLTLDAEQDAVAIGDEDSEPTRVRFNPPTQLSRAAVAVAPAAGAALGKAYLGFGNKCDVQP